MSDAGGNHKLFRHWVDEVWRIPTEHFEPRRAAAEAVRRGARPLHEVLVANSSYSRTSVKRRLLAAGVLQPRCETCGQGEIWRGRRIALVLDHINGVPNDHRLENLRILCPNCAATLETHCGRKNSLPANRICPACETRFAPRQHRQRYCCRACAHGHSARVSLVGVPNPGIRKVTRPPYEQLLAEIEATSFSAVGRKYGVSGNAVRKWLRFYERQIERERRERDGQGARPEAGTEGPEAADEAA